MNGMDHCHNQQDFNILIQSTVSELVKITADDSYRKSQRDFLSTSDARRKVRLASGPSSIPLGKAWLDFTNDAVNLSKAFHTSYQHATIEAKKFSATY